MTDSADRRLSTTDHVSDTQPPRTTPPFAPIFTLVDNASARTINHPHVRYIFSDDDPDILTRALADCEHPYAHESGSEPALASRAMILDLARDNDGGYSVAWASSLSPSWAVLNAQLSQISPPSSDAGHSSGGGPGESSLNSNNNNARPDRLMLRIEGIETSPPTSSSELRRSDETSRQQRPVSAGGQRERDRAAPEGDEYVAVLDEFEKRMATLRKVVSTSEDRRKKTAPLPAGAEDAGPREVAPEGASPSPA
ncbi:hypothetical protein F4861DRAFT_511233 [Xylaria intraflava]|nr:hypothetical protein F4861DRAFT_511233 [Xylaria intraflava]